VNATRDLPSIAGAVSDNFLVLPKTNPEFPRVSYDDQKQIGGFKEVKMGNQKKRLLSSTSLLLATFVSAALPNTAWAQDLQVEEIVVTARKTEETLQTVPLSVTAFTAESLARTGTGDLQSIAALTPGLSFSEMGGNGIYNMPVIRGLAQLQVFAAETSVPVFLDGIYLSNRNALNIPMLDTERVEVIKGPQATLYGQSAYAGAINYVTKDPGDAYEFHALASAGTDQWFEGKVAVGGPLTDKVGFRVAAGASNFGGTFKNRANPSNNLQGFSAYSGSATLVFQPVDDLKLRAKVYYVEQDVESSAQYEAANNCGADALGRPTRFCGKLQPIESFDISTDTYGSQSQSVIASFLAEYEINDAFRLTSLTGYLHAQQVSLADGDFTSTGYPLVVRNTVTNATRTVNANRYFRPGDETTEGYNQELRVHYTHDIFSAMVGAYYFNNDGGPETYLAIDNRNLLPNEVFTNFTAARFPGSPLAPPLATKVNSNTETRAVFGQTSINLTDELRAGAELRWTEEQRKIERILNFGTPDGRIQEAQWRFWTPRFSLDYRPNSDVMIYASAARGYRAGNFNSNGAPNRPEEARFNPETNWTYELGARTAWLNKTLILNASVFHTQLKDLQVAVASTLPGIFITGNAGAASASGVELQAEASLSDNLTGGLGYAYTDPKFKKNQFDYSFLGCGVNNSICGVRDALGGVNIGGKQLPNSSKHQFTAHATYTRPVNETWDWYVRSDLAYKSGSPFDTLNLSRSKGYALVNARLGIESDEYELSLWAKNLFNKDYVAGSSVGSRLTGFATNQVEHGNGRIVGITGQLNF
jgi:iron complex outermembrane receptor protein